MSELSSIARPYAEALFATARPKDAVETWLPVLELFAQAVSDPQIAGLAIDPRLTNEQIFELIRTVTRTALTEELETFLKLVIENHRLSALPEIASQFRQLKNDINGTADCLIESAFALSDSQLADLTKRLASKFPRRLKPEVQVEPKLIGGVRVTVGDRVLDDSVRAQLDAMRIQLTT